MGQEKTLKYIKLLQVTLVAAAVYGVLKYLLPLFVPFVIAYFICKMLYPLAQWLAKKTRISLTLWSGILVTAAAVVFMVVIVGISWYLVTQIQSLIVGGPDLEAGLNDYFERFCAQLARITGGRSEAIHDALCVLGDRLMEMGRQKLPEIMAGVGLPLARGIGTLFIVMTIAFVGAVLLMKNKRRIKAQVSRNIFAREITGLTGRICEVSVGFFRCQLIIIAIICVILGAGLRLMGNRYGILIGVVVAFLDALPVIGSGTVLIPWAVVRLVLGDYGGAAVLVVLYALCTVIREFLEPRLMGDKLGINEFYMLMATFIGIALFGVWGIFLGPLGMIMILEVLRQMEDLYADAV